MLQRAIEMVELGDRDIEKLVGTVNRDLAPLEKARGQCLDALERAPRNRERLLGVLELLDGAIALARRRRG